MAALGIMIGADSASNRGERTRADQERADQSRADHGRADQQQADHAPAELLRIDFEEIDSTNAEALRCAAQLPDRAVLIATKQTAGRGRRGRQWHAPGASNVCLSVFARIPRPAASFAGLSLAVGVSLAKQLSAAGVAAISLKWPNDLLVEGRKLGGILIETARIDPQCLELVIGVGLNLYLPRETEVGQPWIDVVELGLNPDRSFWDQQVVAATLAAVERFVQNGLAGLQSDWKRFDALAGRQVRIDGGQRAGGVVLGIDSEGRLRLRDTEGEWLCHSGEVSVRSV